MWYVVARHERKQNQSKQVLLPVALRHRSNLHILTANLTDTLQILAKITVVTDFSPVPDSKKGEFRTLLNLELPMFGDLWPKCSKANIEHAEN